MRRLWGMRQSHTWKQSQPGAREPRYLYSHTCQSPGRGCPRIVTGTVNSRHLQSTLCTQEGGFWKPVDSPVTKMWCSLSGVGLEGVKTGFWGHKGAPSRTGCMHCMWALGTSDTFKSRWDTQTQNAYKCTKACSQTAARSIPLIASLYLSLYLWHSQGISMQLLFLLGFSL